MVLMCIRYNVKQLGGATAATLLLQGKKWIKKNYQVGDYYIVCVDAKDVKKFLDFLENNPQFKKAVSIWKVEEEEEL